MSRFYTTLNQVFDNPAFKQVHVHGHGRAEDHGAAAEEAGPGDAGPHRHQAHWQQAHDR